jgi:hypothetical protein
VIAESDTTIDAADSFNSVRNRCQSGLRDLHIMFRRVEARPDGADDLAITTIRIPPFISVKPCAVTATMRPWLIESSSASLGF